MKTRGFFLFIAFLMVLGLSNCKNKSNEASQPVYGSVIIDLKASYQPNKLLELHTKIYNAAIKGEIAGYQSDSLKWKISGEEISRKGACEEAIQMQDPHNPDMLIDTVIRNPLKISDITSGTLSYAMHYNGEKGLCKFSFTGYALTYELKVAGVSLGLQPLFFVSKDDLVKLLGEKETSELFANSFKAFLKSLNYKKDVTPEKITSYHLNMSEFLGQYFLDEYNNRIYESVTKGFGAAPLPAYKSDSLTSILTAEDVLKRGCSEESVQMVDPNDPKGETLIDTVIMNPFNSRGNKLMSLSFEWKYDVKKMEAYPEIRAFGISLSYEVNKKPAYNTLFWFDWKNADKVFSPTEISVLKYTYFTALGNFRWYHL